MPQAIPFIAGWVATAFTAGVSTAFSMAVGLAVANAFVYIGGSLLLNKAISALTKKPKRGSQGLEINFSGTIEPRRLIFGKVKVGGMHAIPPISTGVKGKYGHAVIVVAGHEVNNITHVYFDQDIITDGQIGAITGDENDGKVSSANRYGGKAWIRKYLGTSTQTADYLLGQASAAFTSDFRLRGNAYVAVQCEYDKNVYTGFPAITCIVTGQKFYDPRQDTTKPGGSGTHREDDPTTWVYSGGVGNNPALALRHYLTNEVGFSHAEIDDAMVMTAATVCDTFVDIPTAETQRRWTIDTVLYATDDWEDNVRLICDAMRGHCAYVDGKWQIWAGEWQTPDVTINKGDWVSSMIVQASANRDERWNFVRGWYVDPDRNWQRVECYPRRSAAYETADGSERIMVEVEMPYVATDVDTKGAEYLAQRHAEILLRQSRNQIKVSGRMRPEFMKLIPGNTVEVNDDTYGWTAKTFRIVAVEAGIGEEGGADVVLLEEGSGTWTDMAEGEYNTESVISTIDPGLTLPDLTADPSVVIGANTIYFDISEGVPTNQPDDTEYFVLMHTSNYPPTSATQVYRGRDITPTVVRGDTSTKFYWMQAAVGTYRSEFRPTTYGIPVAPMSYGPSALQFTQQPSTKIRSGADAFNVNSARLLPGNHTINSPYFQYAGNNGTVTFSWQVMSNWFNGGSPVNTPSPLVAHTVTNNGSAHPTFYMPSTMAGFDNAVYTQMRLTIRDSVNSVQSNLVNLVSRGGSTLA